MAEDSKSYHSFVGGEKVKLQRFRPTALELRRYFNFNTADKTPRPRFANSLYNSGTGLYIGNDTLDGSYYGDFVVIRLPVQISLSRYRIYQFTDTQTKAPSLWKVFGSNDGNSFYEISTASQTTRLTSYTNSYYEKTISGTTPLYSYIAFVFSALLSVSGQTELSFSELQLFGKEVISNTITSQIYTTSNICKNLILYDTPQVCKHNAFYCQTTTPIYINGGNTQYYKYDIDMTNYTTTGLTPASGYTMTGNKTRLAFTGTMANINAALATLKVNTNATAGNIQISVSATVNPTDYFYNPSNGHFYRPISTGATYSNAKLLSSQQTFKGQQGYLVTITSSDEDAFIFANVPQASIWFALTDEIVEAQWRIDAGPEAGTLIKTSNGQTAGNIQGQYNNWAPGEPNNSGNEDYAVTKWGGGSQWNDLPNHFSCAYVVEFGTWTNPDDATFTEFYTNSVTHSNGEVLRASFNVDFGSNVDETKFTAKGYTYTNNNWNVVNGTARQLSGLGKVDLTSLLDTKAVA